MFHRWKSHLPVALIIVFSLFLFRNYFLKGFVPFPANLLVATYQPWISYPVPEYPNGPPNKPMGFDNLRIYFPLKTIIVDRIKRGQPPLWNPYNFTGNTLLATYQSAVFHPLSFLYLLLPQIDAWSIIIMLQPIIAGLSMYAFLSVFDFSRSARLLGSLTFAFSGFFVVWWQEAYMFTYSALFLPLLLTAVELYIKHRRTIWLAAIALCVTGSIVSGAFQMTFYVILFSLFWIHYRLKQIQSSWQTYTIFCLAGITGLLLSSVHLIPGLEAYYYSSRISLDAKYIFDSYLLPLYHLITLIAPDYFGNPGTYNYFGPGFYHERMMWFGIVPLIFVMLQLIRPTGKSHTGFFRWAFLLTLSLVLSLPTTWVILYYLKLPLLSNLTPSRMMMLVTFSAAVLTAYGTEAYFLGLRKRSILFVAIIFGCSIAAALAYPFYIHYLHPKIEVNIVSLRNLVIPCISAVIVILCLFISTYTKRLRTRILTAIVIIMLVNIYLFTQKFLYFSERRFVYPKTPVLTKLQSIAGYDRFWTYENGYIEKNFSTYYRLFSPEGYDSITIRRYAELIAYVNSHGKNLIPARSDALIPSTDHLNTILTDPYRKKILELLDIRYILQRLRPDRSDKAIATDPPDLPTIWNDGTFSIHELKSVIPHVALYGMFKIVPDGATELAEMFDQDTDLHSVLFLEQKPNGIIPERNATGSATITDFHPNTVIVSTDTTDSMMLFLSDAYFPGWNAYVDNVKTPVYRADYAFRAVVAPQGKHIVEFKYEPISWKIGIAGTLSGLILLVYLVRIGKS